MASSVSNGLIDYRAIAIQAMQKYPDTLQELVDRVDAAFKEVACIGPSLNFLGQDLEKKEWKVSMMLVTIFADGELPAVTLERGGVQEPISPQLIDQWNGYKFYRYHFTVEQNDDAQKVAYYVDQKQYGYNVPGCQQTANMFFTSCNGVQNEKDARKYDEKGGLNHMWDAIAEKHRETPFHIGLHDGDQIYNDGLEEIVHADTGAEIIIPTGVLTLPSILEWLKLPDAERNAMQPTPQMEKELEVFYLCKALLHFFKNGSFSDILAGIPGAMQWGDHDILDGFGSYPPALQNSPVMQRIFAIAQRAYLLFQQHTTLLDPEIHTSMGLFGKKGYSFLRSVGPDTVILGVDTRSERTQAQVVDPDSWKMIFDKLKALPSSRKYLLAMLELPLIYPGLKVLGEMLEQPGGEGMLKEVERFFLGLLPGVMNSFRLVELSDDVDDGWSAARRVGERKMVIVEFMGLEICVILLGGDAHWGAQGKVGPRSADPARDAREIHQFISSAVVNTPPPKAIAKPFEGYMRTMNDRIAHHAHAKMMPMLKEGGGKDGKVKKKWLFPKRNFAMITTDANGVSWRLVVEPTHGDRITGLAVYKFVVPAIKDSALLSDESSVGHSKPSKSRIKHIKRAKKENLSVV